MFRRLMIVSVLLSSFGWACSEDSTAPEIAPEEGPRAPEGLLIDETSTSAVTISWLDLSTDETGFRIERSRVGEEFALVDTAMANAVQFIDDTVTPNETYLYRVRSNRLEFQSEPSNSAEVRAVANESPAVPFDPSPANQIQGLAPVESIVLDWSGEDADGDALSYDLLFGESRQALEELALGTTATDFTLERSFIANRTYFWQVLVTDSKGVSRRSPVWIFSTEVDRVSIPNSFFTMGDAVEFIHPGNPILVSDFNIDRFEVTNQQFTTFLNEALGSDEIGVQDGAVVNLALRLPYADIYNEDSDLGDPDSGFEYLPEEQIVVVRDGLENFPAVEVSWHGAKAYAEFLGRRLPTEAEWEKAARGVSTEIGSEVYMIADTTFTVGFGFPFPWGTDPEPSRGNFDASGDPFENQGKVRTTPVGFYDGGVRSGYATESGESYYGVDDMAGNVWEWCDDWFAFEYSVPHRAPSEGREKVARGGSYREGIFSARTYNRTAVRPIVTDRVIGFRTAATGLLP